MTRDGILKGALGLCVLGVLVCLYAFTYAVGARAPWWMVAGLFLAVSNGFLHTYASYRQLHGKQIGDTPAVKRVMSLLTWGTLVLIFVPLFVPRVWAYLAQ